MPARLLPFFFFSLLFLLHLVDLFDSLFAVPCQDDNPACLPAYLRVQSVYCPGVYKLRELILIDYARARVGLYYMY